MTPHSDQKIVVVGRGLAGAMVAWKFHERGCRVEWWGSDSPCASKVAAGMFNPVSFRRVVEVWNAREHLAEMRTTMLGLESDLGLKGKLLHDVPVVKLFANGDYRDTWDARWAEEHGVCKWAHSGEDLAQTNFSSLEGPAGVGRVHASGWVNVPLLLDALEAKFKALSAWIDRKWSVADGVPEGAQAVVDCRGVGAADELREVGIHINPNHGDVLTLSTPLSGEGSLDTSGHTVNKGKWLLPTKTQSGRQHWRLGATYSWHRMTDAPDVGAEQELRLHMSKAFDSSGAAAMMGANLEAHQAGLRPASPDRRPTVGPWPKQGPGVLMLNGLGTRGVLIAPSMAKHLVSWWLDGVELPKEVLAERFKSVRMSSIGFQD